MAAHPLVLLPEQGAPTAQQVCCWSCVCAHVLLRVDVHVHVCLCVFVCVSSSAEPPLTIALLHSGTEVGELLKARRVEGARGPREAAAGGGRASGHAQAAGAAPAGRSGAAAAAAAAAAAGNSSFQLPLPPPGSAADPGASSATVAPLQVRPVSSMYSPPLLVLLGGRATAMPMRLACCSSTSDARACSGQLSGRALCPPCPPPRGKDEERAGRSLA